MTEYEFDRCIEAAAQRFERRVEAVSYTHLDVYKRQLLRLAGISRTRFHMIPFYGRA